jgi:membrane fusion protein (multidrug efflux system)
MQWWRTTGFAKQQVSSPGNSTSILRTQSIQNMTTPAPSKKANKIFPIVLAVLVLGGGGFGITKYIHSLHHEETDDAQVDANISPIISRVSGYIAKVRVKDFQHVKKGDTLVVLDDRDLKIRVEQAEASLEGAEGNEKFTTASATASYANIATSESNIATIDAQIEAAKVNLWRATQDFNRYSNLVKDHAITQQQYEQASAAKQSADRQLDILLEQKRTASRQKNATAYQSNASSQQINVARAGIRQRRGDLENARLMLSYTVITAPDDGIVSRVNAHTGQFVNAGQSLFSIVTDGSVWVTANFKETQLENMKEGQKVMVTVDAFPGQEFEATLSSFSAATGSKFALLPPDNSTGNFVKVVQRVPVRIEFSNPSNETVKKLRPGMNVYADVHIN